MLLLTVTLHQAHKNPGSWTSCLRLVRYVAAVVVSRTHSPGVITPIIASVLEIDVLVESVKIVFLGIFCHWFSIRLLRQ